MNIDRRRWSRIVLACCLYSQASAGTPKGMYSLQTDKRAVLHRGNSSERVPSCGPDGELFFKNFGRATLIKYSSPSSVIVNDEEWILKYDDGEMVVANRPHPPGDVEVTIWFSTTGRAAVGYLIYAHVDENNHRTCATTTELKGTFAKK